MDCFEKTAGALALIAVISEAILLLIGTPGHSLYTGRAAGEAIGSAITIFVFISIPASITYALARKDHSPDESVVRAVVTGAIFAALFAYANWTGSTVSAQLPVEGSTKNEIRSSVLATCMPVLEGQNRAANLNLKTATMQAYCECVSELGVEDITLAEIEQFGRARAYPARIIDRLPQVDKECAERHLLSRTPALPISDDRRQGGEASDKAFQQFFGSRQ